MGDGDHEHALYCLLTKIECAVNANNSDEVDVLLQETRRKFDDCKDLLDRQTATTFFTVMLKTNMSLGSKSYHRNTHIPMDIELYRFSTYGSFPTSCPLSTIKLAKAGFYHIGADDQVKCFNCGLTHKGWKYGEDPLTIHCKLSPNCSFLKNMESAEFSKPTSLCREPRLEQDLEDRRKSDMCVDALFGDRYSEAKLYGSQTPDNKHSLLGSQAREKDQSSLRRPTQEKRSNKELPKYPQFAIQCNRLITFRKWSKQTEQIPGEKWAAAGFFLKDDSDKVCCFYCGSKTNVGSEIDPWSVHLQLNDQCFFLRQSEQSIKLPALPLLRQVDETVAGASCTVMSMEHPAVVTVKDAESCSDDVINEALDIWNQRNGCEQLNAKTLLEIVWDIKDNRENNKSIVNNEDPRKTASEEENKLVTRLQQTSEDSGIEEDNGEHVCDNTDSKTEETTMTENKKGKIDEDTLELIKENERLKELLLCKVCMDGEAAVVFLPCGHIVTCLVCSSALHKCPVCRKLVRGRVKAVM